MTAWLELEEQVGRAWHRWVGDAASMPRHPEAAVTLAEVRGALTVFFHGVGGAPAVAVATAQAVASPHRLRLVHRLGMVEETLDRAGLDGEALVLPGRIDTFAERALNRAAYFWLAAFLARAWVFGPVPPTTGLAGDLLALARVRAVEDAVRRDFPGLAVLRGRLGAALRALRPVRRLPAAEQAVEEVVIALLGGPPPVSDLGRRFLAGQGAVPPSPRGYRPFLPVPLWGVVTGRGPQRRDLSGDEEPPPVAEPGEERRRYAERRRQDQAERDDPLILNRFEKILALAEMVNVNRSTEDDDEEDARKAASALDVITLARNQRKAAVRLRLDLDLPPGAVAEGRAEGRHVYPEWDWRRGAYLPAHCTVVTGLAPEKGEAWTPDAETERRIRRVRRQFEALRPRPLLMTRQVDGDDLDIEALVRSRCDLAADGTADDRVYTRLRTAARDLSVAVLLDTSLSTDAWVQNRRVLDIAKEALSVFVHGVAACGDEQGIFAFTSRRRDWVRVQTVKAFDEALSGGVLRRIAALAPGYYTRIGAAVRHVATELGKRPHRHRLLLVLTDGKPNDIDHYEGRYGIEDTRKAVQEARRQGLSVFGLTIDAKAQDYFPAIFGRGAFTILDHPARLAASLPRLYRQVAKS